MDFHYSKLGKAFLKQEGNWRTLYLKGNAFERGWQHGKLLKHLIHTNLDFMFTALTREKGLAYFQSRLAHLIRFVPSLCLEEMKGLAKGAGVNHEAIFLLNLFPEFFHCTGIACFGSATQDASLYHVRVLDYRVGMGLQNTAVFMVVDPQEGQSYLSVSYAGFIGVITGMNESQIAIGEIGGDGYGDIEGISMALLLKEMLMKASTLEEGIDILKLAKRTCEYFYVLSDGKISLARGIYATQSRLISIDPGESYWQYDPNISSKDPQLLDLLPQDTILIRSFKHPELYMEAAMRLRKRHGHIDLKALQEMISFPVTDETNLHTVIFHPETLELWIAHASPSGHPASQEPYRHINAYFNLSGKS